MNRQETVTLFRERLDIYTLLLPKLGTQATFLYQTLCRYNSRVKCFQWLEYVHTAHTQLLVITGIL